ncbi:MAG: hypothetical protein ACXAE3_01605 [Candidatus Kariarchaeaceae archaeon]|jgi:hypothetical protein
MILQLIPSWLSIFAFPVVTITIWHLLFNSNNATFTKVVVEGGYMLLAIPLMVVTILAIPSMGVIFWATSNELDREVVVALIAIIVTIIIIVEYFWIKRQVKAIEEREQMTIWEWLRLEVSAEVRQTRKTAKIANKEQAVTFFDEITGINRERRELDRIQKEKLRKALLGDIDTA